MLLANLADLSTKAKLPANDPRLELALRNSSGRFAGQVGYPVGRVTNDVTWLNGNGAERLFLKARPVDVHEVEVEGVVLSPAQYWVDRDSGIIRLKNRGWFPDGLGNVKIRYDHGWDPIPEDVQDAVLEHAVTMARVMAHLQQNSAGSTQESYGQAAMVGTTQKWVDAVAKYSANGDRA